MQQPSKILSSHNSNNLKAWNLNPHLMVQAPAAETGETHLFPIGNDAASEKSWAEKASQPVPTICGRSINASCSETVCCVLARDFRYGIWTQYRAQQNSYLEDAARLRKSIFCTQKMSILFRPRTLCFQGAKLASLVKGVALSDLVSAIELAHLVCMKRCTRRMWELRCVWRRIEE